MFISMGGAITDFFCCCCAAGLGAGLAAGLIVVDEGGMVVVAAFCWAGLTSSWGFLAPCCIGLFITGPLSSIGFPVHPQLARQGFFRSCRVAGLGAGVVVVVVEVVGMVVNTEVFVSAGPIALGGSTFSLSRIMLILLFLESVGLFL